MKNTNEINDNKHSIKANFAYNIIYQCIAIIVPLITSPYVSRILVKKTNKYSFNSISGL